MIIHIKINPVVSKTDWDNYVLNHPQGSVYHLRSWKEALHASFGYEPFYLFALTEKNKICGLLPLFRIKSFFTKDRLVSLPKSHLCDILSDSKAIERLLVNQAKKLYRQFRCDYLEIRGFKNFQTRLFKFKGYATYILNLSENIDEVWHKLDRVSVRQSINKAKRFGAKVYEDNSKKSIEIFDLLNQEHKRNLGSPAQPLKFLLKMKELMPDNFHLYLAKFENKHIAGLINLNFKNTVICLYMASDKKYLKYRPNNLLFWQAIEDSCKMGLKYFDFGRTLKDKEDLVSFKKRWGTEERQLYYYYFPKVPLTLTTNRSKVEFRTLSKIWTKLPIPISEKMSNFLYGHFD